MGAARYLDVDARAPGAVETLPDDVARVQEQGGAT